MLDEILRQHHRADGKVPKAPRHSGVDDPLRLTAVNAQLRRHGGVHFSHAAGVGDDVPLDLVKRYAVYRLQQLCAGGGQQALDLGGHGVGKGDLHSMFLPFFPQYTTARKFGKEKIFIDIQ